MIKKLTVPSRGATVAAGALVVTLSFAAVAGAETFGFGTTPTEQEIAAIDIVHGKRRPVQGNRAFRRDKARQFLGRA